MRRVQVKSDKPRPLSGISRSANASKAMLEKLALSATAGGDPVRISQSSSSLESYCAAISPEGATNLLDAAKDLVNRRVGLNAVRRFATDMASGLWEFPAQPLIVDAHGVLLDGQHRLWAVIEAAKPVKFVVQRMLNIKTSEDRARILAAIDAGTARTTAQNLAMRGIRFSALCAGAARALSAIQALAPAQRFPGALSSAMQRVTKPMVAQFAEKYEAALTAAAEWAMPVNFLCSPTGMALAHCLILWHGDPKFSAPFLSQFHDAAVAWNKGDAATFPPHARGLFARLRAMKGLPTSSRGSNLRAIEVATFFIKAFNSFASGEEPPRLFKWMDSELMPWPKGHP